MAIIIFYFSIDLTKVVLIFQIVIFYVKQAVFNKYFIFFRSSEHFRTPVKDKQAPNYSDVVKNKFDLYTLKKDVEKGEVNFFLVIIDSRQK